MAWQQEGCNCLFLY